MVQASQTYQPEPPLKIDKFSIEQMAELLIERAIRSSDYGLITNMSEDMISDLTSVDVEQIEKAPPGAVGDFMDLHTCLEQATKTSDHDDWINCVCQKILTEENRQHKDIEEYLDRHLKDIGQAEEKLDLDISKKSQIIARHRVKASIKLGPPRNNQTEFLFFLSRMVHPEDGPYENVKLWLPFSTLFLEFQRRLQVHAMQDQGKPGGWSEEDGLFIFRFYHPSRQLPRGFQVLDTEEKYINIQENYKKYGNIAGFWHVKDYQAYERMKVRIAKEKAEQRALALQLEDDEGFSLEEGRLLDELMTKEKERLEKQTVGVEAGSKM